MLTPGFCWRTKLMLPTGRSWTWKMIAYERKNILRIVNAAPCHSFLKGHYDNLWHKCDQCLICDRSLWWHHQGVLCHCHHYPHYTHRALRPHCVCFLLVMSCLLITLMIRVWSNDWKVTSLYGCWGCFISKCLCLCLCNFHCLCHCLLVTSCLLITVIKYLKGQKSLGLISGSVFHAKKWNMWKR